jgi:hypothetical protein
MEFYLLFSYKHPQAISVPCTNLDPSYLKYSPHSTPVLPSIGLTKASSDSHLHVIKTIYWPQNDLSGIRGGRCEKPYGGYFW